MRFANLTQPMPLALTRPIPFLDKSSVVFYTQFQRCGASIMDLSGRGNTGTLNNQSVVDVTFTAGGAGTGTITKAGSMGVFTAGRLVTVTSAGTATNNGTYTITASDANTLTVKPDVTTDAVASGTVTEVATSKYITTSKGMSLLFNGGGAANDTVTITDHASLNIDNATGITVVTWYYPISAGENSAGSVFFWGSDKRLGLCSQVLGAAHTNAVLFLWDYDGVADLQAITVDNAITLNTWNHIAVTWGKTSAVANVIFYVNGAVVSHVGGVDETAGVGNIVSDSTLAKAIGNNIAGTITFDGYFKSILIANRVYTANEINRMYLSGI